MCEPVLFPVKLMLCLRGIEVGSVRGSPQQTGCCLHLPAGELFFWWHSAGWRKPVSSQVDAATHSCSSFSRCDLTGTYRILWGNGWVNYQLWLVSWEQLSQTNETQERAEALVRIGVGHGTREAVDSGTSGEQERHSWA